MPNDEAASAALLFAPQSPDPFLMPTHPATFRLPVDVSATLAAMAHTAGISKNQMGNRVIAAGITAIRQLLDDDTNAEIEHHVGSELTAIEEQLKRVGQC